MRLLHFGYAFTISALVGCAHATYRDHRFIEIPEAINKLPGKQLTRDEVAYDVEQAIYSLETAYSGSQHLPNDEFKNLIANIASIRGPMTADEFCRQIDSFMDKVSDNHLTAKFNNSACFPSVTDHKGRVGANTYQETKGIPWRVALDKRKKATALLVSITGFPKATSPVWNGFLNEVKKLLPKADFVVVDLRGNAGGDDTKGYELSTLLAGTPLKRPYGPQWNSYRPETYQLFVNTFEYWARIRRDDGKDVPPYILDLKSAFVKKRDLALKGERPEISDQEDLPGTDFVYEKSVKKPIYILIDAACGSSCESTTDYFEFNPLVKTVGENTAGYVHFGNNGNVFLKNSGINLQMAVSYNTYLDGRFIEKKGITPKIRVLPRQDALVVAWDEFLKQRRHRISTRTADGRFR